MSAWYEALVRYQTARAAQRAYDDEHINPFVPDSLPIGPERNAAVNAIPPAVFDESQRLLDLCYPPEDELLDMPAPDWVAFAHKVIICRDEGRELSGCDDILIADARRLIAEVAA